MLLYNHWEVTKIDRRILILVLFFLVFSFTGINSVIAEQRPEIRYTISDDTDSHINKKETTAAVIDDSNKLEEDNQIRLPKYMPDIADFVGDGFEYIVLTPEGVQRVNTNHDMMLVGKESDPNPVSAIAGSNYPDCIIAKEKTITHYSFTGSEYSENSLLASGGYSNILSIGTKELDHAVLTSDGKVTYQAFTGNEMTSVAALSLTSGEIKNPIAMTLFKDHYGMAVVDGDEVKYYKEGSYVTSITGTNILSVSAADGGNIAIVTNNEVLHYNLIGSSFVGNDVLSIKSGLNTPTCVALRPGSYDRLIVDGDHIKYFMWTGSGFVENTTMSRHIEGLQNIGKYLPKAVAESIEHEMTEIVTHIKIWIDQKGEKTVDIPEETDIKWYVTAQEDPDDGTLSNWVEVKELGKWISLGEEKEGNKVRWKAVLTTNDRNETPRIYPDIVLQTNSKPNPPTLELPPMSGLDRCYLNSTPTIRWKFNDPDNNPPTSIDTQGGYQVIVSGGSMTENSGIIPGNAAKYVFDENTEGKLFNSGVDKFAVTVRVWDEAGAEAGFKDEDAAENSSQFCVIAFDRPLIKKIVIPPEGATDTDDIKIKKDMEEKDLPTSKAGGLVILEVDSIGVNSAEFKFPYFTEGSEHLSAVSEPEIVDNVGQNNKWQVSFYTNANPVICPNETLVNGLFKGNGIENLLILDKDNKPNKDEEPKTPNWWQWTGYCWWAEGVVKINDTAFKNWSVILQGRSKD